MPTLCPSETVHVFTSRSKLNDPTALKDSHLKSDIIRELKVDRYLVREVPNIHDMRFDKVPALS